MARQTNRLTGETAAQVEIGELQMPKGGNDFIVHIQGKRIEANISKTIACGKPLVATTPERIISTSNIVHMYMTAEGTYEVHTKKEGTIILEPVSAAYKKYLQNLMADKQQLVFLAMTGGPAEEE